MKINQPGFQAYIDKIVKKHEDKIMNVSSNSHSYKLFFAADHIYIEGDIPIDELRSLLNLLEHFRTVRVIRFGIGSKGI